MEPMISLSNSSRRAALLDILLVVLVSAVSYTIELALADVLPWGDEARGVVAVLVGAGFAIWVTLRRGRSLTDLGFTRPNRWWTVPFWAIGIMVAFIVAQAAASFLLAALIDLPEPDLSRYDFIRGNLMSAIAMALVLPVAAAVPEEIVYRGFLVDRFSCLMGGGNGSAVFPVLAQAVVFGSVHFQWGVGGIVLTSIMGAVWGFAFLLCGRNLWIVILAHSAAHIALVGQLYFS
jgi:hypothetical protein